MYLLPLWQPCAMVSDTELNKEAGRSVMCLDTGDKVQNRIQFRSCRLKMTICIKSIHFLHFLDYNIRGTGSTNLQRARTLAIMGYLPHLKGRWELLLDYGELE
jgi:hypothetical protein